MSFDFMTMGDTNEETALLTLAVMEAQDALAEAGIENPKIGTIQEVLASNGIATSIVDGPDGVPVIYRKN